MVSLLLLRLESVCVCFWLTTDRKMWWQRLEVAAVAICAKTQVPPPEKRHARSEDGEAREDETRSKRD